MTMLRWALFACLALLPAQGWGGTPVQHKSSNIGTVPRTAVMDSAVTAGNALIVVVGGMSFDAPALGCVYTVTDNNGNTYIALPLYNTGQLCLRVYYVASPTLTTNPPTITCNDTDGSSTTICDVIEVPGLQATPGDGNAGATVTSTTTPTTNSVNTTGTDFLIGAFMDVTSVNDTISAGSGWTTLTTDNTLRPFITQYKSGQVSGSYTSTATLSAATNTWVGTLAAFKEASAGASPAPGLMMMGVGP